MRDRVSLEAVSVSLPFGIGSVAWKIELTERKAAWSLYSLFGTTSEVLKAPGFDVGAFCDSVAELRSL